MTCNICVPFVPAVYDTALLFAMLGDPLSMLWLAMIARRLLQYGRLAPQSLP